MSLGPIFPRSPQAEAASAQKLPEDAQLMKVSAVAKILSLSTSFVHSLIACNALPHYNLSIGKRCVPRVRRSDLHAFIKKRRSTVSMN